MQQQFSPCDGSVARQPSPVAWLSHRWSRTFTGPLMLVIADVHGAGGLYSFSSAVGISV